MGLLSKPAVEARRRLEADLEADDISIEAYSREDARISAGSDRSEYLQKARAAVMIRRALAAGVALAVGLVILAIVLTSGEAGQSVEPPSNPSVAPTQTAPAQPAPQAQPQQEFDDDDFEMEDDD